MDGSVESLGGKSPIFPSGGLQRLDDQGGDAVYKVKIGNKTFKITVNPGALAAADIDAFAKNIFKGMQNDQAKLGVEKNKLEVTGEKKNSDIEGKVYRHISSDTIEDASAEYVGIKKAYEEAVKTLLPALLKEDAPPASQQLPDVFVEMLDTKGAPFQPDDSYGAGAGSPSTTHEHKASRDLSTEWDDPNAQRMRPTKRGLTGPNLDPARGHRSRKKYRVAPCRGAPHRREGRKSGQKSRLSGVESLRDRNAAKFPHIAKFLQGDGKHSAYLKALFENGFNAKVKNEALSPMDVGAEVDDSLSCSFHLDVNNEADMRAFETAIKNAWGEGVSWRELKHGYFSSKVFKYTDQSVIFNGGNIFSLLEFDMALSKLGLARVNNTISEQSAQLFLEIFNYSLGKKK